MPSIVWNRKLEITPKEIGLAVWLIWMAAAAWYKLGALETAFREHLNQSQAESSAVRSHGVRLEKLEKEIDDCCPHPFHRP